MYVFRMILSVISDYFLKQRQPVDLCNGEVFCFPWGTDLIIKFYLDALSLKVVPIATPPPPPLSILSLSSVVWLLHFLRGQTVCY
jgi:hypothetical protein